MAMSKDKLLEMVENTITTNGAKEITGASLNAALTSIIEAMGTGGGASVELVYADMAGTGEALTADQRAANAAAYAKAAAAAESGTAMPIFALDMSEMMTASNGYPCSVQMPSTMTVFINPADAAGSSEVGLNLMCTLAIMDQLVSIAANIDETGLLIIAM